VINGILPERRRAGQDRRHGDGRRPGRKPYPGGVPLNTYTFFGQQAVSVGSQEPEGEVVRKEAERPLPEDRHAGQPPHRHLRHQRASTRA
jgi:hypothetical protein